MLAHIVGHHPLQLPAQLFVPRGARTRSRGVTLGQPGLQQLLVLLVELEQLFVQRTALHLQAEGVLPVARKLDAVAVLHINLGKRSLVEIIKLNGNKLGRRIFKGDISVLRTQGIDHDTALGAVNRIDRPTAQVVEGPLDRKLVTFASTTAQQQHTHTQYCVYFAHVKPFSFLANVLDLREKPNFIGQNPRPSPNFLEKTTKKNDLFDYISPRS